MNKVFLTGYLASDPRKVITQSGMEIANFSVAIHDLRNYNESYFFQCNAWGQQAQFVNNNLKKGSLVSIDGRLTQRSYVNKEGRNVNVVEIACDTVRTFGANRSQSSTNSENNTINGSLPEIDEIISIDDLLNSNSEDDTTGTNSEDKKKFEWEDEL